MKGCQACVLKSTHQGQEVSAQLGNGSPDANVGGARPRVVVEGEGASLQPDMPALSGVGFCPGSPGQQAGRTACPTAYPLCAAMRGKPEANGNELVACLVSHVGGWCTGGRSAFLPGLGLGTFCSHQHGGRGQDSSGERPPGARGCSVARAPACGVMAAASHPRASRMQCWLEDQLLCPCQCPVGSSTG